MSEWIDVPEENIDYNLDDGTFGVWFEDNDFGARYFSINAAHLANAIRKKKGIEPLPVIDALDKRRKKPVLSKGVKPLPVVKAQAPAPSR